MDYVSEIPLVSVVMINWNRRDVLQHVLSALGRQTYKRYEIIICDNHSTDGAPEMVVQEFPDVQLIRMDDNIGIAGYNIAFRQSSGEIIVILDNDSFLEDEGIAKIVNKFQTYQRLGALGCKVFNYYSGQIHHWHPNFTEEHAPTEGVDTPLFNGCAAAARSQVLHAVGFYPEDFFLYENERDLCTRIINAGYDIKYFTDIAGYHMVAEEGRSNERLIYYARRNRIWYFWKYLPIDVALYRTALTVASSIIAAVRTRKARLYLRPLLDSFRAMPRIIMQRAPINKSLVSKVLY